MASLLELKVSEEQYKRTISQLAEKIAQLQNCKQQLQGHRSKLESSYQANQAKDAIESEKTYEQRVQDAIDKLTKQKDKIQAYLDNMEKSDTSIRGEYASELQTAQHVFD